MNRLTVHSISRQLNIAIGSSLEIMTKYSANIPTVMVKSRKPVIVTPDYLDSYDSVSPVASEVSLPASISSCFILYPYSYSYKNGEVLACEISTYESNGNGFGNGEGVVSTDGQVCSTDAEEVFDGQDSSNDTVVLQTIVDRDFINVCKLVPGYLKKLKIFTAAVPCSPRDAGHDVELNSLSVKLYCRSGCIQDSKLWSASVDYLGGTTTWNGGPCQLVCRKGDYKEIQIIHYDSISEIEEGIYLFHLSDVKANVDIIWNTLPTWRKIQEKWGYLADLIIPPGSFEIVQSYPWIDLLPKLKYLNDEINHFKSKKGHIDESPFSNESNIDESQFGNESFLMHWSKANNLRAPG